MKNIIPFVLTCILCLVIGITGGQKAASCKIWFDKPAESWETEALPIGNGRIGAMLFGGVDREIIQFNEQGLWSGDNNWDGEYLTGDHGFGSYRNFGEIIIEFQKQDTATYYTRSLDISNGIHRTEFVQNGVLFTREAFSSFPDQVMVFKYSADAGAAFSGRINLIAAQGAISLAYRNHLSFQGEMPNNLKYAALVYLINEGGKVKAENDILTFEHWAFTNDSVYLRQIAYPMIREICEHWEDRLKPMPDGTLMVPDGWSPEHGPREDGVMFDQQLVWDLFQNYLDAAITLNIDEDYQKRVAEIQAKLAPNKTGRWGQLQEWQEDRDDPEDQHRHTSHLFAVFPGRQISLNQTPELAQAAIISLRSRSGNFGKNENQPFTVESTVGDSRRSWTWPWRCALWARLGEGENAGIMVRGLLTYNTLPNLFCSHPPFQIDGNLGIPAAMAEMLIQSHNGKIILLPALPGAWAEKGSFSGLCARGGYVVNCEWDKGKVVTFEVKSSKPGKVKVFANGSYEEVEIKPIDLTK